VHTVVISSDGKRVSLLVPVMAKFESGIVKVVNYCIENTGRILEGHSSLVSSVLVSSDAKRVFTGSHDKTARIWDVESGQLLRTLDGHSSYVSSIFNRSFYRWKETFYRFL